MDVKLALWTLVKKEFSIEDIIHAPQDEEEIQKRINELVDAGIIESIELDNYQVCDINKEDIFNKIKDLTEDDYNLAVDFGVINETNDDSWKDATIGERPEEDQKVVLLIQELDKIIFNSTKKEFILKQNTRLATWKDSNWILLPPHPKYDTRISAKNLSELSDAVKASAWRQLNDKEEEMYLRAINMLHPYEKFEINIDEKNEKDMFEALTFLRDVVIALMDPSKLDKGLIGMTNRSLSYLSDIINKINFGE